MYKYITQGKVIDHDNNDREYTLAGVKTKGSIVIGGQGYCIEIRENKEGPTLYVLTLVTEVSNKGSVAIKVQCMCEAILKNFTYIGSEEL